MLEGVVLFYFPLFPLFLISQGPHCDFHSLLAEAAVPFPSLQLLQHIAAGGDLDEVWRCLLCFPRPSQDSDQCSQSVFQWVYCSEQTKANACPVLLKILWGHSVRTLCSSGSLHQKLDHGITGTFRLEKPSKSIESNCSPSSGKATTGHVLKCHIHS